MVAWQRSRPADFEYDYEKKAQEQNPVREGNRRNRRDTSRR